MGNLDSMSCELQGAVDYMRSRARAGRSLFKEHGMRSGTYFCCGTKIPDELPPNCKFPPKGGSGCGMQSTAPCSSQLIESKLPITTIG